jgi:tRNA-specific 2-thiouridylase
MGHIAVGISGGVDSAVAASLLIEKGYDVEGIFMKNWEEDSEYCTVEQDYKDALQVCDVLKIPLRSVNFAKEYWEKVFRYFLEEYKNGRTPNPDIMCNSEIKFKEFLKYAIDLGANKIATGHYVRSNILSDSVELLKGVDKRKDQSYFLHTLTQKQLSKSLFPLGKLNKAQVREHAEKKGFNNFNKKDSVGICFIGERNFKNFLKDYLPSKPGNIVSEGGRKIGTHDGLMFHTIGQRKGLKIGGGNGSNSNAWYVIEKDIDHNELIVGQGHDHPLLYKKNIKVSKLHWINDETKKSSELSAKIRYRAEDQKCSITELKDGQALIEFEIPQFAIANGQSVVFYSGEICLGGATINSSY